MFFWKKPTPTAEPPAPKPQSPPMTAEQFIEKFRRNYVNYAALIDVAFGLGDEMEAEYDRLSVADRRRVVQYAKDWAQNA
jgi:hypothetical protein